MFLAMRQETQRGGRKGIKVLGINAQFAQSPGIGELHAAQLAPACLRVQHPLWHDGNAQPPLDHAAQSRQAGNLDTLADDPAGIVCGLLKLTLDGAAATQADQVMFQGAGKAHGLFACQIMLSWHDQNQSLLAIGATLELGHVILGVGKTEISLAAAHGYQDFVAGTLGEIDRNFRIVPRKTGQFGSKELLDRRSTGKDGHMTGNSLGKFLEFAAQALNAMQQFLRMTQQALARRRGDDTPGMPNQQGGTHRGNRQLPLIGRRANAAALADQDEKV